MALLFVNSVLCQAGGFRPEYCDRVSIAAVLRCMRSATLDSRSEEVAKTGHPCPVSPAVGSDIHVGDRPGQAATVEARGQPPRSPSLANKNPPGPRPSNQTTSQHGWLCSIKPFCWLISQYDKRIDTHSLVYSVRKDRIKGSRRHF